MRGCTGVMIVYAWVASCCGPPRPLGVEGAVAIRAGSRGGEAACRLRRNRENNQMSPAACICRNQITRTWHHHYCAQGTNSEAIQHRAGLTVPGLAGPSFGQPRRYGPLRTAGAAPRGPQVGQMGLVLPQERSARMASIIQGRWNHKAACRPAMSHGPLVLVLPQEITPRMADLPALTV